MTPKETPQERTITKWIYAGIIGAILLLTILYAISVKTMLL